MYSEAFCKVYNEFGWNYFPEAFGEQLLAWIDKKGLDVKSSLDLGCGTGVLCEILSARGIKARGMDFSEGMIAIARERAPHIPYDVGDMVVYRPEEKFDLITCTGDALNHIISLGDVEKILENVYGYLNEGGYFVFDILNEKEIPTSEPIELPFSEDVTAWFQITQEQGIVTLSTTVHEKGKEPFTERINETVHDADKVLAMLKRIGYCDITISHQLLENANSNSSTWYITAGKGRTA